MSRKKSPAAPAKPLADRRVKDGRSVVWLQGLLCGGFAACAPSAALLLSILLAPGMAMLAFERQPGRPVTRAMLLFGSSASVFPMLALWDAGHTVDAAWALAAEPRTLAIAWAAAGGAWLFTELVSVAMRLVLASATRARKRRLRAISDRCMEEWGLEAASGAIGLE